MLYIVPKNLDFTFPLVKINELQPLAEDFLVSLLLSFLIKELPFSLFFPLLAEFYLILFPTATRHYLEMFFLDLMSLNI